MNHSKHNTKVSSAGDTILTGDDSILTHCHVPNSVLLKRAAREWSQAELAKRAGISRAAVSAIESGRLTPSVMAALSLARVLECTVEELFGRSSKPVAADPTWAWQPWQEPCRYWEAEVCGRRLLYPAESISLNPFPQDGVWRGGVCHDTRAAAAEMTLTVATCDPAAALLAGEYARESGFRMLVFSRGGGAGLELARSRAIHVAALHRSTTEHPDRNAASVRAGLGGRGRLLRVARWEAGLAHGASVRTRSVTALSRRVRQWAAREPGSAARESLEELLGGKTPAGRVVESHTGVTEAVRAGWAEAGVCVKVCAMEARLNFLPLQTEALDFCFHASLENDPRIQALIRVLRGRRYRQMLAELPGYDARLTGELGSV
jgi:molybdate-binding protein/DNA-binding XRE family transcriptional regulator